MSPPHQGFYPERAHRGEFDDRLQAKLELVPVLSSNRIEFLQQGKIDIVVATMSDTPERRKVVQAIDPPGTLV